MSTDLKVQSKNSMDPYYVLALLHLYSAQPLITESCHNVSFVVTPVVSMCPCAYTCQSNPSTLGAPSKINRAPDNILGNFTPVLLLAAGALEMTQMMFGMLSDPGLLAAVAEAADSSSVNAMGGMSPR